MTQNRVGLEYIGGIFFTVAGYGRLRLFVGQGDGDFRVPTRKLTLEHVPNLGNPNLISMKRLTRVFDQPMPVYTPATVTRPLRGGKPLNFHPLRRKNGLLKIRVRLLDDTKTWTAKPSAFSPLVAEKRKRRDIMESPRVLEPPSRETTQETARMTGKHRLHAPRREGIRAYISALSKSQAFPEQPERVSICNDFSGDEPVEDLSELSESGSDSVEQDKSDNYDSERATRRIGRTKRHHA